MSFLDQLENSLKSLEGKEEADGRAAERAAEARAQSRAVAPWADQLRNSEYTKRLLDRAAAHGHQLRAKMYMAWLEGVLRLEIKGHACELVPTAAGVEARYKRLADGQECIEALQLMSDDPELLLQHWLHSGITE